MAVSYNLKLFGLYIMIKTIRLFIVGKERSTMIKSCQSLPQRDAKIYRYIFKVPTKDF